MIVALEDVKVYLRIDHDDEDILLQTLIHTAETLCEQTLRKPIEEKSIHVTAVLFCVAYLYEHQEDANMDELSRMLRYILATEREVMF